MKNVITAILMMVMVVLTGCSTDAQVASANLSKAADQFEINRRIVFYDAIQGSYLLSIEGRCSLQHTQQKLTVTCRTSETGYKKHFLGISDNVTYFAEQLEMAEVSVYRYKVIFKPASLIPDIDVKL
jgi:hypothetical protein